MLAPLSTLWPTLLSALAPLKTRGDDPARAARAIIHAITGHDPAAQIARPDTPLPPHQAATIMAWATRHADGEPLSRLRGTREFYGLDFALSPATLDPRPETEGMVDAVLTHLQTRSVSPAQAGAQSPLTPWPPACAGGTPLTLLDLGTGTGCIPIAILKHAPNIVATAVDLSADALNTARANAVTHGVENRITFLQSDWFDGLPAGAMYNVITSNPPYIPDAVVKTLEPGVRLYDPILALDGGPDGLDAYTKILAGGATRLAPQGILVLEVPVPLVPDVTRLAGKYGLDAHTADAHSTPQIAIMVIQKSTEK